MAITWTKEWQASDDGTIVSGLDLKNIQDDITSGSAGDATSIWSVPVIQPTAAEDGKVIVYDHSSPAFDYVSLPDGFQVGMIVIWSGAISAIASIAPAGTWALCDGTGTTPNLTDRFIIHADVDSGAGVNQNNVGDSGGGKTISIAQLPAHSFNYTKSNQAGASTADGVSGSPHRDSGNATTATNSIGSGDDFVPKYYALAYIMKTS